MKFNKYLNTLLVSTLSLSTFAAPPIDLTLEDPEDIQLIFDNDDIMKSEIVKKEDDFDILKEDIGELEFLLPDDDIGLVKEIEKVEDISIDKAIIEKVKIDLSEGLSSKEKALIFDIGKEEKNLLVLASKMKGKIPDQDWNEIAAKSTTGTYEVVDGDWLWKISQRIFGSGFYYSKIWALNPYITNPHEIEPGMILSFSTGSDKSLPSISVNSSKEVKRRKVKLYDDFDKFGEDARPDWIDTREELKRNGIFIQYSSSETLEDLKEIGEMATNIEFETYEPPRLEFEIAIPSADFDETGFDRNTQVGFKVKEGFYLNTFLSNNLVQDFGKIESAVESQSVFSAHDKVNIRFDEQINIVAGDKFSTYSAGGIVKHENSDRSGYKYTITSGVVVVRRLEGSLWECKILESTGIVMRGDRITVYTPKIERITKTYNSRLIEALILAGHQKLQEYASFGDVVYIDRGRADGVEVGNIFEVYGFKDRATKKNITPNPSYKNGELTVITVSDNFSTALVTNSVRDFSIGDISISKTKDAAIRAAKVKMNLQSSTAQRMNEKALDELDVDLNLDDLNDSLLDKADKIQFTEDELSELERQEREKSIISENEKDLLALERLEGDIQSAEKMLNEARLDEDKLLEGESLEKLEKELGFGQQDALDEIEENFGKRYLDEELNDKENPYGLTEFDIEEIDELLNVESELQ